LEPAIHKGSCSHDSLEVEYESIRLSIQRLMTFPFIAERVAQAGLQLIGAHFKINDGTLSVLDPQTQQFQLVDEA
jgi:carbonic anhydrase